MKVGRWLSSMPSLICTNFYVLGVTSMRAHSSRIGILAPYFLMMAYCILNWWNFLKPTPLKKLNNCRQKSFFLARDNCLKLSGVGKRALFPSRALLATHLIHHSWCKSMLCDDETLAYGRTRLACCHWCSVWCLNLRWWQKAWLFESVVATYTIRRGCANCYTTPTGPSSAQGIGSYSRHAQCKLKLSLVC